MGTATFYEMFRFEPVGKYLVNICGTLSCALMGAHDLMHRAEEKLGIKAGATTSDGMFTLAHAECQAACTEAPCLQVNYRYRFRVTPQQIDELIDDDESAGRQILAQRADRADRRLCLHQGDRNGEIGRAHV